MMTREQRQFIQCVAALTMLIDHIGAVFFPTVIGFRAIGRLSFPLFAFGIAQVVTYTSDFRKYFMRVLIAAVISQPVYLQVFEVSSLNPLFMLAWGAVALYFWREEKKAFAGILLLGSYFADMSYGWYGVWTIFFFGFYGFKDSLCFYGQVIINVLYGLTRGAWVQILSLFAFSFLDGKWRIPLLSKKMPRYFFYAFYPLHLLVLLGIKMAV
jgi:hypothetical protein